MKMRRRLSRSFGAGREIFDFAGPGEKKAQLFQVQGIPHSFLYDREGKMVAQAIDMRTKHQFQEMLALVDLR